MKTMITVMYCDDHGITYFNDRLKQVENIVSRLTCAVNVVYVLFTVRDSLRAMYKFLLFTPWLIQLKHHFHNEKINKIVLKSHEYIGRPPLFLL